MFVRTLRLARGNRAPKNYVTCRRDQLVNEKVLRKDFMLLTIRGTAVADTRAAKVFRTLT